MTASTLFRKTYPYSVNLRFSGLNAINKYMLNQYTKFTELSHDLRLIDQSYSKKEFRHYTGLAPKKFI